MLAGKEADKHTVVGIGAGIELKFIEELAPGKPFTDAPRGSISRRGRARSSALTTSPVPTRPKQSTVAPRRATVAPPARRTCLAGL